MPGPRAAGGEICVRYQDTKIGKTLCGAPTWNGDCAATTPKGGRVEEGGNGRLAGAKSCVWGPKARQLGGARGLVWHMPTTVYTVLTKPHSLKLKAAPAQGVS